MGRDQHAEREEREEQGMCVDGPYKDGGDDEGPEGHEEEGQDMGVDADGNEGAIRGVNEVTAGDGLPGIVPAEDAADDEAVGVDMADIGTGGLVRYEWEVLSGLEVVFQPLPDRCDREGCRHAIFFKKKISHANC